MIVDTHCHLDDFPSVQLSEELDLHHLYLTMGTGPANWSTVLQLSERFPNVFSSLGLHPWYVDHDFVKSIDQLQQTIQLDRPTAMGEIGLDFSVGHIESSTQQIEAFKLQLMLALEYDLPVSLHVYKAHNEMIQLLKQYPVRGVVHSLGTSLAIAQQYIDLGFKFGVNSIVLRENARRYHELVSHFGLDSIVLETDAPNIHIPGEVKVHLNDIHRVVEKVAQLTSSTKEEVIDKTSTNANQIFRFLKE